MNQPWIYKYSPSRSHLPPPSPTDSSGSSQCTKPFFKVAEQKKKDTDLENSLLDSVGEGEGGMFQENSIETCILDAWDKRSDLVHWEDPEGSGGEGGGRWDRDGEYL